MDAGCEFTKKVLLFVRITHERSSLFNDAHPSSFETNIEGHAIWRSRLDPNDCKLYIAFILQEVQKTNLYIQI